MLTTDLAPARTFSLPKAPTGDSAAARQLARALYDTADSVTGAQQLAHRIVADARPLWSGASPHSLDELDRKTRAVAAQLRQAAEALAHYAGQLDKAHQQHHWSWTKVLKVAAVVAVTATVVVVTVGAAAPAAAAADAALVTGEIAATATAVTAATTAAAEATEAVLIAVRALRALRAVAAFLRPQIGFVAGLTDLEAFQQVRRTGTLDAGSLARHAGTNLAFGAVGGTLAGAVGGFGAEAASPLAAWLLPKAATASAWGTTTAAEEYLLTGHIDPATVAESAGFTFAGSVIGEFFPRVGQLPAGHGITRVGKRIINLHPNAADPKWGLTKVHLMKHFRGVGPFSLKRIDPGGTEERWLSLIEVLANTPTASVGIDGVEKIVGRFARSDGQGTFAFGIRVFQREDGTYDLVTLLTRQRR